jgi:adenylate cyclase
VECAVEIQRKLEIRNADLPENRMMKFGIGINLGDVIEEGERIYGDGVNIAARIEGFADGGTICISGTVYDQVKRKLSLGYEFLGKQTVKNITDPVRVYRVPIEVGAAATGPSIERRAIGRRLQKPALSLATLLILVIVGLVIWYYYTRGDTGFEATGKLKPITVLIRMMGPQERWFTENILKEFEIKNHCKIILKRFGNDYIRRGL